MTKISLQYVQDEHGIVSAVQIPFSEWEKLIESIKTYEQLLQVKTDLRSAFAEVQQIHEGKRRKKD